jgi:tetratricopeptide (TPR) repeat protein
MRRTRTSSPGLKHLAFFEALAEAEESTPAYRAATAGLLALRLVDHWVLAGPAMVEPESVSVRSVREAIMAIAANDPRREVLLGLVNAMQTMRDVDVQAVLPRIFAYGGALERMVQLALAADAYESVIRLGEEEYDGTLVIDSYMRLGYCRRTLGTLPAAEGAYLNACSIAKRRREPHRLYRSQIGLANVVALRGNLPEADEMLREIVRASTEAGFRDVSAFALHDHSIVAQRRGDIQRAVCLAYEALQLAETPSERDRVLSDIGAFFVVMERYDAARDALLVLEATTTVEVVRLNTRVNMLALAARSGDRAFFESLRRRLDGFDLPVATAVNYLIESARGFRRFGSPELAEKALKDAVALASAHGLNCSVFESEQMLSEDDPAVRTTGGEIPSIQDPAAHVVQALRLMAEALPL